MIDGQRLNVVTLRWFAPVLIATGILGALLPRSASLLSGAPAYNTFHLVAGALGLAILATGRPSRAVAFNLGFGAIDLWQAIAGVAGWPPARWFALGPADHVVHAIVGLALLLVGSLGVASLRRA